jgi:hypothetical protein
MTPFPFQLPDPFSLRPSFVAAANKSVAGSVARCGFNTGKRKIQLLHLVVKVFTMQKLHFQSPFKEKLSL